jgi:hypothetical protein
MEFHLLEQASFRLALEKGCKTMIRHLIKLQLFGLIVFSACVTQKQSGKEEFFYCDFEGKSTFDVEAFKNSVKLSSKTDGKIDTLLKKITELSFPYRGFDLIEDKSGNSRLVARAVIEKRTGYRYILYNKSKLLSIDLKDPEAEAAILGVLAHEIAHLNFGHGTSNHKFELLADTYSGWVQKKLGVSRGKCILSLHDYIPVGKEDGDAYHPPKKDRIPAMVLGWDMAVEDKKYRYSNCCDTSFYSYFTVEGLVFNKSLNEGKTSFVDFTIRTFDNEGKELEVFGGQIIHDQNIKIENNKPIILFEDLGWVIKNKRFTVMQFEICSCQQPCDGKGERSIRQCRTIQKHVKIITENLEIPFDKYGYLKLKFSK